MGDPMPYHLEKGPVQRILEMYFNDLARARIDVSIQKLENGGPGNVDWLNQPLFTQKGKLSPLVPADFIAAFAKEWLGVTWNELTNRWDPAQTSEGGTPQATGYWHSYQGDVAEIMRKGLWWALKIAQDLPVQEPDKPLPPPPKTPPLKMEILWKCPNDWFEMWVLRRPVDLATAKAAVVTVLMATPSAVGATVARSPIAKHPVVRPDGSPHPLPSWQFDYEELGDTTPPIPVPVTPSAARKHAMWVVTHADHELVNPDGSVINPDTPVGRGEVAIPQGAVYRGIGDVVIVSPSVYAGGVAHDGMVV